MALVGDMFKRMTFLLILVAALGLLAVAQPSLASAASSCSGSRIEHLAEDDSGMNYGYLDVYWNSSTGLNCAMNNKTHFYGTATFTYAYISVCSETVPGGRCTRTAYQQDPPNGQTPWFSYYAGPVSVSAVHHCIYSFAQTSVSTTSNLIDAAAGTSPFASHCT